MRIHRVFKLALMGLGGEGDKQVVDMWITGILVCMSPQETSITRYTDCESRSVIVVDTLENSRDKAYGKV